MPKMQNVATDSTRATPQLLRNLFRSGRLRIRARLTACFLVIILSMLAASFLAMWQFRGLTAANQRLNQADRISLAAMVVHIDVDTIRNRLVALADTRDGPEFAIEASSLRRKFLDDATHAQQLFAGSSDIEDDPLIHSTLQAVRVTLPSQVDSVTELAAMNDWSGVRAHLANQVQGLRDLSSLLAERVDSKVSRQRSEALESAQRARRQLMLVLPAMALFPILLAILLGWYVTRTITEPLSRVYAGAQAWRRADLSMKCRFPAKTNGNFGECIQLCRATAS